MAERYECDKCGACCSVLIVEIVGLDVIREPRLADVATQMRGFEEDGRERPMQDIPMLERDYMLVCGKRCGMLDNENNCRIYPTRPTVCVAFEAGSEQCQDARESVGLQPLLPVA